MGTQIILLCLWVLSIKVLQEFRYHLKNFSPFLELIYWQPFMNIERGVFDELF